jgi:glycosyltransferase involved in cell wall biosynthesis
LSCSTNGGEARQSMSSSHQPTEATAPVSSHTPVKIAFGITELDPGGAERALVELVTRLDRGRFQPMVYCLGPRPRGNPTSLADRLEEAGISTTFFGARSVMALPRVVSRLRWQMVADSPRIVQTFLFHANIAGAWAAQRAGVPHVVTGIRVAERRARWHLRVARWADRLVDRHVCVSESVRVFSISQGGLSAEKLAVIPNAVDMRRFADVVPAARQSLGIAAEARLITCIGRLDRQKGIEWLLEVLRDVVPRVPNAELLLVGDGPEHESLQRLARRICPRRVHFLGFRTDVPQILAASDLVVLPSRWEGMPNVVLEAMASGRAVVATDVEGVREALGPNALQQVVAVDDPRGFAERIVLLLNDAELRNRLQKANFRRAGEAFSFAAMVDAYERLYWELLSGGLAAAPDVR